MFALSILNTQSVDFFVIHSFATNTSAEPPDVIPLVNPSASTIPEEDEQPKKRHCPSKSLDD